MMRLAAIVIAAALSGCTHLPAAQIAFPGTGLPPEEFDHPYTGQLDIVKDDDPAVIRRLCNGLTPVACAYHWSGRCIIYILTPLADNETILRHEIGHCNGWPANHPGERLPDKRA
jgi:hypothetical protein